MCLPGSASSWIAFLEMFTWKFVDHIWNIVLPDSGDIQSLQTVSTQNPPALPAPKGLQSICVYRRSWPQRVYRASVWTGTPCPKLFTEHLCVQVLPAPKGLQSICVYRCSRPQRVYRASVCTGAHGSKGFREHLCAQALTAPKGLQSICVYRHSRPPKGLQSICVYRCSRLQRV